MTAPDAPTFPAIVIGGGVAGLTAAYQLVKRGVQPLLIEARRRVGGLVFGRRIGDVWVDVGAEAYAKRGRCVTALCHELGLETIDPADGSWIVDPGRAHAYPLPQGVLGIPADLDDPALSAALSPAGLERARLDLAMGPEPGAEATQLADLVATRLGEELLRALVAPVAGGIHSADPALLSPDAVAPGLRAALREHGSLVAAAAALRSAAPAGSVVSSVRGGMFRLPDALEARISDLGGEVVTQQLVTGLRHRNGVWEVQVERRRPAAHPWLPGLPDGDPATLTARTVIMALDGRAALDLLRPLPELAVRDWLLPRGADLVQVSVAIDDPRLDAAPRGSGALVTPDGGLAAKALTHYTAKWPWARRQQGHHVLRISYGRAGTPTPEPSLAEALADASVILGLELDPRRVLGTTTAHFANSLPPHTPEHRTRVSTFQDAVAGQSGLGVTGAWIAGSGLAETLPHAEATVERLLS